MQKGDKYEYKGFEYEFINIGTDKSSEGNYSVVIYKSLHTDNWYIRELEEFKVKFKKVDKYARCNARLRNNEHKL